MKYEEIKIGDVFDFLGGEETVISKNDKYRFIVTIDSEETPSTWSENELHQLKPIQKQLPEEGLLVSKNGTIVYRTGELSGYGFYSNGNYENLDGEWGEWTFDGYIAQWRKATKQEEEIFIEMLKKECESRGLYEDTKIENHAQGYGENLNTNYFYPNANLKAIHNKNGQIFYKGKFATPLKEETTLELVSKAVKEKNNLLIEQTESGIIILTPIKK